MKELENKIEDINSNITALFVWIIILAVLVIGLFVFVITSYEMSPKKVCTDNPYIIKISPKESIQDLMAHEFGKPDHFYPSRAIPDYSDSNDFISQTCAEDYSVCLIKMHNTTCEIK